MKKLYAGLCIGGTIAFLASCKKDYVCECTGIGINFSWDTVYQDVKKKDADLKCNSMDFTFSGYGQDCELK